VLYSSKLKNIHKKLFKEEDEDIKKLMKMIKNYRTKKEIKD
jgi:hypothetical protein